MAHANGQNGNVSFTNLTAGTKGWSLDYSADALETTDFADSGKRTYIAGLSGWSGSVDCVWDPANTAVPGDTATLTLTADTGDTYAGTAIMTGLSLSVDVAGVNTVSYSFQGSGTLTITL